MLITNIYENTTSMKSLPGVADFSQSEQRVSREFGLPIVFIKKLKFSVKLCSNCLLRMYNFVSKTRLITYYHASKQ